ncbi:18232_t:CDS:1 [Rhizophagus irregularis]|nr:18232_t:CDS:1 [Rhizophagus irregularis]
MQRVHDFIMFKNGINHNTIKKKASGISNLLNFIIWNIMFFSLFPLASASIASFVDIDYVSHTDLYDAILNTFFPIFFVIFLNASGKDGSIKNIVLPLLDDVLYNMITWVIPLVVSFAYDDLMNIKIFSIINMCLHVFCAVFAIIKWKRINYNDDYNDDLFLSIILFLIIFPVLVIPIFWIIIITHKHTFDSIPIIFLILFGICLVSFVLIIITLITQDLKDMTRRIIYTLFIICFYVPNILQTLLITLFWPINFYFVKACVFVLILSLTRNVSYFADKVPGNFLATSTTLTQCGIRSTLKGNKKAILKVTQISIEEMHEKQETMQTKIDEIDKMQTTMQKTTQTTIDDMQKTMQAKIDEIQKIMNEIKTSVEETK